MTRWKVGTILPAALLLPALMTEAAAQTAPDFTGNWTVRAEAPAGLRGRSSAGHAGSGWGPSFTIVQRSDRLIVERAFFSRGDIQPQPKFRYALDGSETVNTLTMGRGFQTQRARAAWDGEKLVLTIVHTDEQANRGAGVTSETIHTLSLQPSALPAHPPSLIIVTTRKGIMGAPSSTTRTVYTRQ